MTNFPISSQILALVRMAVDEDLGRGVVAQPGDRTVMLTIPADMQGEARVVAREAGVFCGGPLTPLVLREYADYGELNCTLIAAEGSAVAAGATVAALRGSMRALLAAERVLLNFYGALSGVASATRRYVDAVANVPTPRGKPPAICDTRKTRPGYRGLEKYAVRCGGGLNHRMGLYDGVMLKDNHLAAGLEEAQPSLAELTRRVRAGLPPQVPLWLEVDTLEQLADALPSGGADIILLDNMPAAMLREAVALRDRLAAQTQLEASGGITLANVQEVAATGVDRISIGAITHSAPVLDLSLEVTAIPAR